MFEVGYSEILVIAIVLIVVVGPKDLPKMLRAFGKTMTKFRQMSGDFQRQFNDALKEAELDDVRKTIADVRKLDPRQQVRDVFNPLRDVGNSLKADLNKTVQAPVALAVVAAPAVVEKAIEVTMGGAKPVLKKAAKAVAAEKSPPAKSSKPKVAAKTETKTAPKATPKAAGKVQVAVAAPKAKPASATTKQPKGKTTT